MEGGKGVEDAAVARALTRFGRRMEQTPEVRQKIAAIQKQMYNGIGATAVLRSGFTLARR